MKTSALIFGLLLFSTSAFAEDVLKPAGELPSGPNGAPAKSAAVKTSEEAPSLDIPDRGAAKAKASMRSFSGVVNAIREGDRMEVVFKTGEVFYMPHGSKQAAIFDAVSGSERNGGSVSISYDSRTNVIETASGGGDAPPAPTPAAAPSVPGTGFQGYGH